MRRFRKIMSVPLAVSLLGLTTLAFADDAATSIYSCTTIKSAGSYKLANNITATSSNVQAISGLSGGGPACILIAASDVTLDLTGHTIAGPPGSTINGTGVVGVITNGVGFEGITLRDGVVTGFFPGIELFGSGHRVERIRALDNLGAGISVGYPSPVSAPQTGHQVVGNTVTVIGNTNGVSVQCPSLVLQNVVQSPALIYTQGSGCILSGNVPPP